MGMLHDTSFDTSSLQKRFDLGSAPFVTESSFCRLDAVDAGNAVDRKA